MKYDLLIVGNGFDLGCDFKTTYTDFLKSFSGKSISNPLLSFFMSAYDRNYYVNDEWNGFENLLCQYLQFLDYCFRDNDNIEFCFSNDEDVWGNVFHRYYNWRIKDVSKLPINMYLILCLLNPMDGKIHISIDEKFSMGFAGLDSYPSPKELFFKIFVNAYPATANKEYVLNIILEELNNRLLLLENELRKYISVAANNKTNGPLSFLGNSANMILSFNYSKTAQTIYNIDNSNVVYIHGDVSSNIILGVEPLMIKNQSFGEESNYIKFFKRFRRIYKNCNSEYNEKIINKLTDESTIAIYGHSLDLSDKSILKPIFEKKFQLYDIYCHRDIDTYKLKLAKLIGLDLYSELFQDGRIKMIKVD